MRYQTLRCGPALLATVALAACTEVTALTQSSSSLFDVGGVFKPANAQLIATGAIGDFECAFNEYVMGGGLLVDEVANGGVGVFLGDNDARRLTPDGAYGTQNCGAGYGSGAGVYTPLSVARATTDTALAKLKSWTDAEMPAGVNRGLLIGKLSAYAGYSLIFLGEAMCSAAINGGPELTPAQLFLEAKARFDTAVVYATSASDASTVSFARLGRARTLLNLARTTDSTLVAAAEVDAQAIPAGFVIATSFDGGSGRRRNSSFAAINQTSVLTVESAFHNLTIDGASDPRVALTNTGRTGSSGAVIWTPNKYPSLASNLPIARWAEAQLIIAEARLVAGDLNGAASAINAVRATWSGLPTYDATGQTVADMRKQIIEERSRELFLEGHRLGDMRRLDVPLSPSAGTPHPNAGGVYGDLRCYPLPDIERVNNPNISK